MDMLAWNGREQKYSRMGQITAGQFFITYQLGMGQRWPPSLLRSFFPSQKKRFRSILKTYLAAARRYLFASLLPLGPLHRRKFVRVYVKHMVE